MAQIVFKAAQQDITADPGNLSEALAAIIALKSRYNELIASYNQLVNYLNGQNL